VLGKRLPYDNLEQLRKAIAADVPHFAEPGRAPVHAGADASVWDAAGGDGPLDTTVPFGHAIADYYLTNPIARASVTMAACSREFASGAHQMAAE
jgi:NADH-quinone oxidoreductase subunit G